MKTRRSYRNLAACAAHTGLHVRSYSPGDGVTRYRFLSGATPEIERDYFAASSTWVLGTVLGMQAAYTWLTGFNTARVEYGIEVPA